MYPLCLGHILILTAVLAQEEAREEEINERIEKENANFDDSERRFMDNLNDEEWHVAHLKPTDFESTRRSGCKEDTFEDKVRKYRKSVINDPGHIKFVSADPLPFDEKDLDENKCPTDKLSEGNDKKQASKAPHVRAKDQKKSSPKEGLDIDGVSRSSESEERMKSINVKIMHPEKEAINTATTVKTKEEKKEKVDDNARRGEYLFSSAEYEEDVLDFDESECPGDAIEVIVLEQDLIRTYDVECELSLEWRSLE